MNGIYGSIMSLVIRLAIIATPTLLKLYVLRGYKSHKPMARAIGNVMMAAWTGYSLYGIHLYGADWMLYNILIPALVVTWLYVAADAVLYIRHYGKYVRPRRRYA